jgi:hypothetical protein
VADFIHSNTWLLRNTGNGLYGDRLERAFHNAAPGALSRSYTKHVYYQSANLRQIPTNYREYGSNISRRWELNEMHTPPCCTGNQARLLPNYIHHSWTATSDGGLAATMYGPNVVSAAVGGGRVNISSATAYPFEETVVMTVSVAPRHAGQTSRSGGGGLTFPLHLRLPGWCKAPTIAVNGVAAPVRPNRFGFHVERRLWASGDVVTVTLPMEPRLETAKTINVGGIQHHCQSGAAGQECFNLNRNNEVQGGRPYATLSYGPLLFALPLEKPGAEWRYALVKDQTPTLRRTAMPAQWDWPAAPPLTLAVKVRKIANFEDVWTLPMQPQPIADAKGGPHRSDAKGGPHGSDAKGGSHRSDAKGGPHGSRPSEETVELVPYGCAKVFKVSMFPYL